MNYEYTKNIIIINDGSSDAKKAMQMGLNISKRSKEDIQLIQINYSDKEATTSLEELAEETFGTNEKPALALEQTTSLKSAIQLVEKISNTSLLVLPYSIKSKSFKPFKNPIKSILDKVNIPVLFINELFPIDSELKVAILEDLIDSTMNITYDEWKELFFEEAEIHLAFQKTNIYQNEEAITKKMKEVYSSYQVHPDKIHILNYHDVKDIIMELKETYDIDLIVLKNYKKDFFTKLMEGNQNRKVIKEKEFNVVTEKVGKNKF